MLASPWKTPGLIALLLCCLQSSAANMYPASVSRDLICFCDSVSGTSEVELSNYTAYKSGSTQVTITWTSLKEENNDHFTLERSADGIDFSPIAIIRGG